MSLIKDRLSTKFWANNNHFLNNFMIEYSMFVQSRNEREFVSSEFAKILAIIALALMTLFGLYEKVFLPVWILLWILRFSDLAKSLPHVG